MKARLGVDGAIRAAEPWSLNNAAWNKPPQFVTESDADIEWNPDGDSDAFFPRLRTEPEAMLTLPIDPPWYVDSDTRETGTIDALIPAGLIDAYLAMPPMTYEEAAIVRAAMREFAPLLPAPPASDADAGLRLIESAPVPTLLLDTLAVGAPARISSTGAAQMELDIALLDFDYDGIAVTAGSPDDLLRLDDGTLVPSRTTGRPSTRPSRTCSTWACARSRMRTRRATGRRMRAASSRRRPKRGRPSSTSTFRGCANEAGASRSRPIRASMSSRSTPSPHSRMRTTTAGSDGWFNLELSITVEAQPVRLEPLLTGLFRHDRRWLNGSLDAIDDAEAIGFHTGEGRRFSLRAARIKPLVRALIDFFGEREFGADAPMRVPALEVARLSERDDALQWRFSGASAPIDLPRRLRGASALRQIAPPADRPVARLSARRARVDAVSARI